VIHRPTDRVGRNPGRTAPRTDLTRVFAPRPVPPPGQFSASPESPGHGPATADPRAGCVCIVHVTVIDTEHGTRVPDQTVTIDRDRIQSVRPSQDVQVPTGAVVLQGSGKYLIPGLWDMHVHVWNHEPAFPVMLANGVTGVREMGGPLDAQRYRQGLASRGVCGPHLCLGSPLLDGKPQMWAIHSIEVSTPEQAREVVQDQARRGADFIKVYDRLTRETYYAITDASARLNIPFVGHVPHAVSAREAAAARQRSIEHLTGVALACSTREEELRPQLLAAVAARSLADQNACYQAAYESFSEEKCLRLFSEFKRHGTWQVPTLSTWESYSRLDDRRALEDPRLRYFSGAFRFMLDGRIFLVHEIEKSHAPIGEVAAAAARELAFDQQLVGRMFRAGVPLLAGTDAGAFLSFPGFSLHDELAHLVRAGVSPLGALQAATRNPAIYMEATGDYGAVSAGKMADLVLLDADPIEDIRNTARISTVLFGGRLYDRPALDRFLETAMAEASLYATSQEPS
jgi:Amidohydrolase family